MCNCYQIIFIGLNCAGPCKASKKEAARTTERSELWWVLIDITFFRKALLLLLSFYFFPLLGYGVIFFSLMQIPSIIFSEDEK